MARQLKSPADPATSADAELEILHPERTMIIAGRALVVREYGFIEGLRLRPLYKPFADDLYAAFAERAPDFEQVLDVIARHVEAVTELAAVAADVEAAWVRALSADDGELLLMLWWGANAGFFIRRFGARLAVERAAQEQAGAKASAGANSMPPSSRTTTTASSSGVIPAAS